MDLPHAGEAETAVKGAHRAFEDATWQLTQAQQHVTSGRQRVHEAQQRLAQVRRDLFLQREHPELWERRQALAQDPRATGEGRGDYFRWKWERRQVTAEIAAVCATAGV